MDAAQAASVEGPAKPQTKPPQEIKAAALTDGTFILGLEVLSEPAFADRADLLKSFPQVDYSTIAGLVPKMVGS